MDLVHVYTDGASRGNPGPAAIGVVVCDGEDRIVREHREYLGIATNNEAEYRAVLRGLTLAAGVSKGRVLLTSDSELVVNQLSGKYRVQDERLARLAEAVRDQARAFASVEYRHRPRMTGRLARADALANEALDRMREDGGNG